MLIGHHAAKTAFMDALGKGRVHHAWLITGPKGIGKRKFADWAALKLLSGSRSLEDGPEMTAAQNLVTAGSHPDHRILTPPEEGRGSATSTIIVEQIRDMSDFLHSYPALAGWRVLIVDSIDDMNVNTANAFLKELEEPRPQTIYLLVSHAPARLLPTIRSRCRTLRLFALDESETRRALELANPDMPSEDLEAMVRMADGAPGAVSDLAGTDLLGLEQSLDRIAYQNGDHMALARSMAAQTAIPRLKALLVIVQRRLYQAARQQPDPRLFDLYARAEVLGRDAVRLAYDRQQVALALADITAQAGRIQENR